MKVERIREDGLRIWLSDEEMAGWGVTYDTLRRGNPRTDRLIRQILRRVRQESEDWESCLLEAIPVEGGCLVLVSLVRPREPEEQPMACRVGDEESLFQLASQMEMAGPFPPSSLYGMPWGYILTLSAHPSLTAEHRRLAEEYGHPVYGAGALAAAREYGCLLAEGNALEQLTGRVPPSPDPQAIPH